MNDRLPNPTPAPDVARDLFRPSALQGFEQSRLGKPSLSTPPWWRVIGLVLAIGLVGAVVLALSLRYPTTVSVSGVTEPQSGYVQVYSPVPGRLTSLAANVGQAVHKGDVLATVSAETWLDAGRSLQDVQRSRLEKMTRDLTAEQQRLARHREDIDASFNERQRLATAEIARLERDIHDQEQLVARLRTLNEQVEQYAAGGHVSKLDRIGFTEKLLAGESRLSTLTGALGDERAKLVRLDAERKSDLRGIDLRISELGRNERELELRDDISRSAQRTFLLASTDGVVAAANVPAGSAVNAGAPVLAIMRPTDPLIGVAWVPPDGVARLAPGQQVRVRYRSYPYAIYGVQSGRILEVPTAPSVVSCDPATSDAACAQGTLARYRVRIALASDQVSSTDGIAHRLRPGAAFDASIIVDRTTLFEAMKGRFAHARSLGD